MALGSIRTAASPAVPAIIKLLDDKVPYIRPWAVATLGEIGPEAKLAVPALTKWLVSNVPTERIVAADALGAIGPEAKSAVALLTKMLDRADERCVAAEALGKIDADGAAAASPDMPAAAAALAGLVQDQDRAVSEAAFSAWSTWAATARWPCRCSSSFSGR